MTLEDDGDHRVEGSLQHQIREAAEIMTRLTWSIHAGRSRSACRDGRGCSDLGEYEL